MPSNSNGVQLDKVPYYIAAHDAETLAVQAPATAGNVTLAKLNNPDPPLLTPSMLWVPEPVAGSPSVFTFYSYPTLDSAAPLVLTAAGSTADSAVTTAAYSTATPNLQLWELHDMTPGDDTDGYAFETASVAGMAIRYGGGADWPLPGVTLAITSWESDKHTKPFTFVLNKAVNGSGGGGNGGS